MKHRFILISRWHLACGIDDAWSRISTVRGWPRWWPQVRTVRVDSEVSDTPRSDVSAANNTPRLGGCAANNTPRVGAHAWIEWKTQLGYGLKLHVITTSVLAPFELEGTAKGDLLGRGLWLLEPQPDASTMVTYRWDVRLNRAWMRVFAPLLRPLFAWNHFKVMHAGALGLASDIGCRLLEHQDFSFVPSNSADDKKVIDQSSKAHTCFM